MLSYADLAGRAGVDPWRLRDDLASGNPAEITGLAQAFAQAAGDAELATGLSREASDLTAHGYTVDNTPVHDQAGHVEQTVRQLGGGGDKARRIAQILDAISDDLEVRITGARSEVTTLEGELSAIEGRWTTFMQQTGHHLPPEDQEAVRNGLIDEAVGKVRQHGGTVRTSVDAYEDALSSHLKSLADLGYIPPDALDEGPGDVNLSTAQAQADAGLVNGALGGPPGRDGLNAIIDGSRTVALLNAKVAAGFDLTAEERAYLDAWYNTVGADNLAKLPGYVREAAPSMANNHRGPDGLPMDPPDAVYQRVLSPIADGIMNLSDPDKGGHRTFDEMPQAIKDLANTRLGWTDPNTGIRYPNGHFFDGTSAHDAMAAGIDGMGRYSGFADLLDTADVTGGVDFTKHLASSAVQAKQDLNAMEAQTSWYLRHAGPDAYAQIANMDRLFRDDAPSTMLGVVADNHAASSEVLLDTRLRQSIMGLNWDNETGAAALMHSGTERDPSRGGGTEQQAKAALAVIQEVASDRDGYLAHMGEQMEDSVKDIGLQYIDSFGRDTDRSEYAGNLRDPLGRGVGPSFTLSGSDRDRFLQFISGTGDDDATDFQAKATAYSQAVLTDAFRNGNPEQVQEALHQAGVLDGAITQANFDYTFDHVDADDKQAAAAHRAESLRNTAIKTGISIGASIVGTAVTVGTGGAASPVVGITTAVVNGGANLLFTDDPAPAAQLPKTRDELLHADNQQYGPRRDYLVLSAAVDAGVVDPSTLPAGLVRRDSDGGYSLLPPGDLDDTQSKSDLRVAAGQAVNSYEARHRTPENSGDVDTLEYDNARRSVADGTWDHDNPRNSPWSDDHRSRELTYGGNEYSDGDLFPAWPSDRRNLDELDDPDEDPFS